MTTRKNGELMTSTTRAPKGTRRAAPKRFAPELVGVLASAKILGVCAGAEHRYTAVWVVVVEGRVFARSWNDKPTGWLRAFRGTPRGTIRVGTTEVQVRAKGVRSAQLRDAVTEAFAAKYNTPGSRKWVVGFAEPARVANTLQFEPA